MRKAISRIFRAYLMRCIKYGPTHELIPNTTLAEEFNISSIVSNGYSSSCTKPSILNCPQYNYPHPAAPHPTLMKIDESDQLQSILATCPQCPDNTIYRQLLPWKQASHHNTSEYCINKWCVQSYEQYHQQQRTGWRKISLHMMRQ